jgi:hypothetical protein
MGILEHALKRAAILMITKSASLKKIDTKHIISQKLGNNPVDSAADNNVYSECRIANIRHLVIAGFGEKNEQGIGALREIDYASYVTKMGVAVEDIPLIRTNGPFSSATLELENFLHIWRKYYGSRTSHRMLSINDQPANPFTIISSGIVMNDRNIHFDMMVANVKLLEINPGELKYFGDLILFASENIGFGANYARLEKYSENSVERTTLSVLNGNPYGSKLLEAVESSFSDLEFICNELQTINPKLSDVNHLLWVSNNFKSKITI